MGFSALNRILILQIIVMLGLSVFITLTVSSKTKDNAIDHMKAIGEERAKIIETFVDNAEKTLTYFSRSPEVLDVVKRAKELSWQDLQTKLRAGEFDNKAAQAYTEALSKDIGANNEGLWIGSLDTIVINHTNSKILGMMTRKEAKQNDTDPDVPAQARIDDLISKLKVAGNEGVYNTGIIISPGSGEQCLSLYKGVFENGELVGFVGLGIYTQGLLDTLNAISIPDMQNATYSMANIRANADGKYTYIFNSAVAEKITKENAADVTKPVDNDELVKIIEKHSDVRVSDEDITDKYEYNNGKSMVATYTVIPKYSWILTVDDTTSEVYSLTHTMILYLGIFGAVILGLIVVFNIINKRQAVINQKLVSTIAKNNMTKKSLNTAMFKDVLTGVNNRVSFTMNLDKIKAEEGSPVYFAMFNIIKFSEINSQYGAEAGDLLLVKTSETLTEFFPDNEIYRTGSDEFMLVVPTKDGSPSINEVMDKVNIAFRQMRVPKDIENVGTVYPEYKVAVGKRRAGAADVSIISSLKKKMNESDAATIGNIECIDL
ncbi:diguanylate cyclase (GGDEF) domain-containing protein [Ruminococcaceae bacterium FB2012]|nr:diguanylate cyclase (GGDEF) domain-containing protein [Ruminococcaceae bacterium FB2012]